MNEVLRGEFIRLGLVPLAGLLAELRWLEVGGINPNSVLVALIVAAYGVRSTVSYVVAAVFGIALVQSTPGFEIETGILLGIAIVARMGSRYVAIQPLPAMLSMIIAGTIIWYLIIDSVMILDDTRLILWELLYNSGLGVLFYSIVEHSDGTRS